MRESFICEDRDCHIEIHPALLAPEGYELVGTRVCHWSEPLWYIYVDPTKVDAHGMIAPEEQRRLSEMAERMHMIAGAAR